MFIYKDTKWLNINTKVNLYIYTYLYMFLRKLSLDILQYVTCIYDMSKKNDFQNTFDYQKEL